MTFFLKPANSVVCCFVLIKITPGFYPRTKYLALPRLLPKRPSISLKEASSREINLNLNHSTSVRSVHSRAHRHGPRSTVQGPRSTVHDLSYVHSCVNLSIFAVETRLSAHLKTFYSRCNSYDFHSLKLSQEMPAINQMIIES